MRCLSIFYPDLKLCHGIASRAEYCKLKDPILELELCALSGLHVTTRKYVSTYRAHVLYGYLVKSYISINTYILCIYSEKLSAYTIRLLDNSHI